MDKRVPTKRGAAYTLTEDMAIIKAYTSISEDGITGNDQKRADFEQRVYDVYTREFLSIHIKHNIANTPIPSGRTGEKVCRRAKTIKADVLKFDGIFNIIKDAKNTGVTEVDEVALAVVEFKKRQDKAFKYVQQWEFMNEENILKEYLDIEPIPKTPE